MGRLPSRKQLKRALRRARRWGLYLGAGFLGLALAACAAVQTPWAKRLLAEAAREACADGLGWQVSLAAPEGFLPFSLRLPELRAADADGPWLEASGVTLELLPWPLGTGLVSVRLRADRLAVERAPRTPGDPAPAPAGRPLAFLDALAPLPGWARAHVRLDVEGLRLGPGLVGPALAGLDGTGPGAAGQVGTDQIVAGQADTDQIGSDQAGASQASAGQAGAGRAEAGQASASQANAGRAGAGRAVAGRLSLEARVSGGALDARASLAARPAPGRADRADRADRAGRAGQIDQTDRAAAPATALTLEARFDPGAREASLRLDLAEEPGGMAAALAGLAPDRTRGMPLSMTLQGQGPLSDWRASLEARAGREDILSGALEAALGRTSADDAGAGLALSVDPAFLPLAAPAREALGPRAELAFRGALSSAGLPEPQWRVLVQELAVSGKALRASLRGDSGPMGLAPRLTFALDVLDPGALGLKARARDAASRALAVSGALDADVDPAGPLKAALSLSSPDLATLLAPLGVALGGEARVAASLAGDLGRQAFDLTLDAGLSGLSAAGHGPPSASTPTSTSGPGPALAQALGREVNLRLEAGLSQDRRVTLSALRLSARAAHLEASGGYALDTGQADLAATLSAPDLAALSALTGAKLAGSLAARVTARGAAEAPRLTLDLDGKGLALDATRFDRASLRLEAAPGGQGVAGTLDARAEKGAARLRASTAFSLAGQRLALADLQARGPGLELSGLLDAALDRRTASGRLKASADLAPLGAFLGRRMSGRVRAEVSLAAAGPRQDAALRVEASGVSAEGATLKKASVEGSFTDVLREPRGGLSVALDGLGAGGAAVESVRAKAQGRGKAVDFTVAAKGALPEAFEASTEGTFSPAPGGGALRLERLEAAARGLGLSLARPVSAAFAPGSLRLEGLRLALRSAADKAQPEAQPGARAGAQAGVKGEAVLTASGSLQSGRVEATAEVSALSLALLEKAGLPGFSGTAGASLRVTGRSSAPQAEAHLTLSRVALPGAPGDAPPVDAALEARLAAGRLEASLRADARPGARPGTSPGVGADVARNVLQVVAPSADPGPAPGTGPGPGPGPGAALAVQAALPARLSLEPFAFAVSRDAPLEASLKGELDLALAAALAGDEALSLQGVLRADFAVSGRLSAPEVSGRAELEGGQAGYVTTGTRLRDIALLLEASGGQAVLRRFSARDAGQGGIALTGRAGLAPGSGHPFEASLSVERFTPVRTDMATATLSARVDASGGAAGARVRGDVHVGPVEVNLPGRLPPDATPIAVEMGPRKAAQTSAGAAAGPPPYPVELDVAVDFPGRVFVRGLGLDSLWAGNLRVQGSPVQPEIGGAIRIVKGQLDLFGKSFNLARGEVTFHGARPPVPMLEMEARTQAGDLTASILVTGNATRPSIEFSSDPAVPRDEILSRVLFGQSVSSLTPPQALQLAQAVAAMTGAGGSLDFLGATRRLAGLDYLGVKSSGQSLGQSTVAAGKYVADGVYVEASQGLAGASGAVSVQVDVTRNITIDSKVGLDSKTEVGVNWKFDY